MSTTCSKSSSATRQSFLTDPTYRGPPPSRQDWAQSRTPRQHLSRLSRKDARFKRPRAKDLIVNSQNDLRSKNRLGAHSSWTSGFRLWPTARIGLRRTWEDPTPRTAALHSDIKIERSPHGVPHTTYNHVTAVLAPFRATAPAC